MMNAGMPSMRTESNPDRSCVNRVGVSLVRQRSGDTGTPDRVRADFSCCARSLEKSARRPFEGVSIDTGRCVARDPAFDCGREAMKPVKPQAAPTLRFGPTGDSLHALGRGLSIGTMGSWASSGCGESALDAVGEGWAASWTKLDDALDRHDLGARLAGTRNGDIDTDGLEDCLSMPVKRRLRQDGL